MEAGVQAKLIFQASKKLASRQTEIKWKHRRLDCVAVNDMMKVSSSFTSGERLFERIDNCRSQRCSSQVAEELKAAISSCWAFGIIRLWMDILLAKAIVRLKLLAYSNASHSFGLGARYCIKEVRVEYCCGMQMFLREHAINKRKWMMMRGLDEDGQAQREKKLWTLLQVYTSAGFHSCCAPLWMGPEHCYLKLHGKCCRSFANSTHGSNEKFKQQDYHLTNFYFWQM